MAWESPKDQGRRRLGTWIDVSGKWETLVRYGYCLPVYHGNCGVFFSVTTSYHGVFIGLQLVIIGSFFKCGNGK